MSFSTDDILKQRGDRYGSYEVHSAAKEAGVEVLKSLPNWGMARPIHRQAAHMIVDKLVRAFNGDFMYEDNWQDIEGYARLVRDHIEQSGTEPKTTNEPLFQNDVTDIVMSDNDTQKHTCELYENVHTLMRDDTRKVCSHCKFLGNDKLNQSYICEKNNFQNASEAGNCPDIFKHNFECFMCKHDYTDAECQLCTHCQSYERKEICTHIDAISPQGGNTCDNCKHFNNEITVCVCMYRWCKHFAKKIRNGKSFKEHRIICEHYQGRRVLSDGNPKQDCSLCVFKNRRFKINVYREDGTVVVDNFEIEFTPKFYMRIEIDNAIREHAAIRNILDNGNGYWEYV